MESSIKNIETLVNDIKSLNERKVREIQNFENEFLNYLNNKIKEFFGQKFAIVISGMYEDAPRSNQRDTRPNVHPFEYIYAGILGGDISMETKKLPSLKLSFFENKNSIPINTEGYHFCFIENTTYRPKWSLVDFYKEFLTKDILETLNLKTFEPKNEVRTEIYFGNEAFDKFKEKHSTLSFNFLS